MDDMHKEMLVKHINEDYPEVLKRIENIEKLLTKIDGGVTVLKWIGYLLSGMGTIFIFFKDHIFHLGK